MTNKHMTITKGLLFAGVATLGRRHSGNRTSSDSGPRLRVSEGAEKEIPSSHDV